MSKVSNVDGADNVASVNALDFFLKVILKRRSCHHDSSESRVQCELERFGMDNGRSALVEQT
jgi:hypothetical protein